MLSLVVLFYLPFINWVKKTHFFFQYIDASHFWANTLESEYFLAKIEETLNKQLLHQVVAAENSEDRKLKLGKIYATRYHEDNLFYRCKIISYSTNSVQVEYNVPNT